MTVYYNEFNPESAAILRQMMKDGIIPHGEVDERSITEVRPDDLTGFNQIHFFAGIGGWAIALRLAGWPEDRPVWTGSCPCQPFSAAGRQKGKRDDRHLWPVWERLVRECRPPRVYGEQVASAIAHGWLDDVYQGLEAINYAVGSAVLPACSVGAPHKRDRLYFVAHSEIGGEEHPDTVFKRKGSMMKVMGHDLSTAAIAVATMWATPTATDAIKRGKVSPRKNAMGLTETAHLWSTPSSRDWKDTPGMTAQRKDGKSRNDQLPRQVFGTPEHGSNPQTGRTALLNPAFPCWLMGFSTAALSSMQSAMQSFRPLRQNLSKQPCKENL